MKIFGYCYSIWIIVSTLSCSSTEHGKMQQFPFEKGMKLNASLPHLRSEQLAKNLDPIIVRTGVGYSHEKGVGFWEYYSEKCNRVYLLGIKPRVIPFPEALAKIITGEDLTSTDYFLVNIE